MPEYLAPGVYVEEVSFRSKSIEGVGTSTCAFVGPTLKGPVGGTPELLTSFADFQRIYGGFDDLSFGTDPQLNRNYVAHAVRFFFNNGGARLYVVRVFGTPAEGDAIADAASKPVVAKASNAPGTEKDKAWFVARFPGSYFNRGKVVSQQSVLPVGGAAFTNASDGTLARVHKQGAAQWIKDTDWKVLNADGTTGAVVAAADQALLPVRWLLVEGLDGGKTNPLAKPVLLAAADFAAAKDKSVVWAFPDTEVWERTSGAWKRRLKGNAAVAGNDATVSASDLTRVAQAFVLAVRVEFRPAAGDVVGFDGLQLAEGAPRDIRTVLAERPNKRADQLTNPIALHVETPAAVTPLALLQGLVGAQPVSNPMAEYEEPSAEFPLSGGADGTAPSVAQYEDGFGILTGLEDVSIVAAPGYSARSDSDYRGIQDALITHVNNPRRYRIGVLDSPPDQTPSTMRLLRGLIDSTHAALYYPWVVVNNPLAGPNSAEPVEITLPPSGFVCGIYARSDIERGVWKAPANEVVSGALRFERNVNFGEQELLNPIGVNCLRYLSGRGYRVWGARTVSSDPEWKYVNVRRYFCYLEASIDRGTQWAVFEPNGDILWANIRGTIGDFLYNEWKNGALLGTKPEEAFFVRCDRTTMTQNDLDNGRLICLIGVAAIKPAEFVIFRIGQKTADAKS